MLKNILSITGKPGLFKIIAHNNRSLIVEDINSKKRFPVSARDRVVSLGDIAIYTLSDDKPLSEVLDLVYANKNGEPVDIKNLVNSKSLRQAFAEIFPDYDEERVRESDIKKLLSWYNLLTSAGFTKFTEDEKEEDSSEEENGTKASKEESSKEEKEEKAK